MNFLRYLFACFMWRLQCWGLLNRRVCGRLVDWAPVSCGCGWRGPVRWLYHTYHGYLDDWEPVSECPECGARV